MLVIWPAYRSPLQEASRPLAPRTSCAPTPQPRLLPCPCGRHHLHAPGLRRLDRRGPARLAHRPRRGRGHHPTPRPPLRRRPQVRHRRLIGRRHRHQLRLSRGLRQRRLHQHPHRHAPRSRHHHRGARRSLARQGRPQSRHLHHLRRPSSSGPPGTPSIPPSPTPPTTTPTPWATASELGGTYPTPQGLQPYTVHNVPGGFSLMFLAGTLSALLGIGSGASRSSPWTA